MSAKPKSANCFKVVSDGTDNSRTPSLDKEFPLVLTPYFNKVEIPEKSWNLHSVDSDHAESVAAPQVNYFCSHPVFTIRDIGLS